VTEKLEEDREHLEERLREHERIALESQAEAAVYRDMLQDCYKAAAQALADKDLSLLHKMTGKLDFNWMPSGDNVKEWGKYFLDAYVRDARWLSDTQNALEQIKDYAEKLSEGDANNAELKELIIDAAEKALITHV
jgi:DNA-binding transcriptional MerR regulator